MACTDADWQCLLSLFFENDVVRDKITDAFGAFVSGSGWNAFADWIKQYGQLTVGVIGLSFGAWRWYVSREAGLHRHLLRYIQENRLRLDTGVEATLEALNSPTGTPRPRRSLFAVKPLRRMLARRNWSSTLGFSGHTSRADAKLSRALKLIDNRIDVAERAVVSLRRQQVGAHLIKGAIASAQAERRKHKRSRIELDVRALDEFRTARSVPGHNDDLQLLEYEAHQKMKLGQLDPAEQTLDRVVTLAKNLQSERDRDMTIARARLRQAQILQARVDPAGNQTANGRIRLDPNSALHLRAKHEPFSDWDLIDQGYMKVVAALIANRLDATNIEANCIADAETAFRSAEERSTGIFSNAATKRLNRAARRGLVEIGRIRSPRGYNVEWLLPPKSSL